MAGGWIEIRATGRALSKNAATAALISAGSPGVLEEHDPGAEGKLVSYSLWDDETAEEESRKETAALKAYLPIGEEQKLKGLTDTLARIGWKLKTSTLKETDWSEKWKKGLKPIRLSYKGASILVKPTWKKSAKRPGEKTIEIDPGMAFGTGGHATTKMCLKAILRLVKDKKLPSKPDILDVGTGTGVLAIAAMKLGFRKAVGIDIDKVAVTVARKNAKDNRAEVVLSDRPVQSIKGRFSLVAANILAGELIRLSLPVKDRVRPGGWLILSGILSSESDTVIEAYTKTGLEFNQAHRTGEWVALLFRNPQRGRRR